MVLTLAASVLTLTVLAPSDAEAQRRGFRAAGTVLSARAASWSPVRATEAEGYYRRGFRPGLGLVVSAGALAVGAAAAGASYYGGDPCLQQQQYWTGYGYQTQWVRVC